MYRKILAYNLDWVGWGEWIFYMKKYIKLTCVQKENHTVIVTANESEVSNNYTQNYTMKDFVSKKLYF